MSKETLSDFDLVSFILQRAYSLDACLTCNIVKVSEYFTSEKNCYKTLFFRLILPTSLVQFLFRQVILLLRCDT